MQNQWASILNPLLGSPLAQGKLLSGIALVNGTTIINHTLGRKLQGWILVSVSAPATINDNQLTNPSEQLTLSLTSNATCTVSLWVF